MLHTVCNMTWRTENSMQVYLKEQVVKHPNEVFRFVMLVLYSV
jgi:hypothetical protein